MSKRFNLREFQQQVLDRLHAQTTGAAQTSTLGIKVGETYWLVNMADISEVLPLPGLTPVPLTKPWYCGVANVRGTLYSLVDLGVFLNNEAPQRDAQNRVLLLGQRFAFNTGLLVSRVLGLRNTQDWQRNEINGELLLQDSSGQVWHTLDIEQLIQKPEFLQIGA